MAGSSIIFMSPLERGLSSFSSFSQRLRPGLNNFAPAAMGACDLINHPSVKRREVLQAAGNKTSEGLAFFHSDRNTTQSSVLIGNIAIALIGSAQRSIEPVVFAVITGGRERGSLQPHVFAGGNV